MLLIPPVAFDTNNFLVYLLDKNAPSIVMTCLMQNKNLLILGTNAMRKYLNLHDGLTSMCVMVPLFFPLEHDNMMKA